MFNEIHRCHIYVLLHSWRHGIFGVNYHTQKNDIKKKIKVDAVTSDKSTADKKLVSKKLDRKTKIEVDALVVKLGDASFKVRKQAMNDLKKALGEKSYLKSYLKSDDVEIRENVKEILRVNFKRLKSSTIIPNCICIRVLMEEAKPETEGERLWLETGRQKL